MKLGQLTQNVCLDCGASPPYHQIDCPRHPAASFWGKQDSVSVGRSLRLATVQNVFNQGLITEVEAREILSGPLSSDNLLTVYDDAGCLQVLK
jgi:hypothetical protein